MIIIENENYIVIGKKKIIPGRFLSGKWHIPGGGIEEGESDYEALQREMREELSIRIIPEDYIARSETPTHSLVNWYICKPRELILTPGSDLENAIWVPKREVIKKCAAEASNLWPQSVVDYLSS